MKKNLLCLSVSLGLLPAALAQTLTPTVVAAAGGSARTSSMSLEWTAGEAAVRPVASPRRLYTQGFHQPLHVEKLTLRRAEVPWQVSASPNPTTSAVNVRLTAPADADVVLDLTDASGRTLLSAPTQANAKEAAAFDLSTLPAGMYLIQVRGETGRMTRTHKVIKQ